MIYVTLCFKIINTSTSSRHKIMINGNSKACEGEVRVKILNLLLKILCILIGRLANNRHSSAGNSGIYMLTFPFLQQKAGPSSGYLFAWQNSQFLAFLRVRYFFGRSLYTTSYESEPLEPVSGSTAYSYSKSA
jgi:hypothetical protein